MEIKDITRGNTRVIVSLGHAPDDRKVSDDFYKGVALHASGLSLSQIFDISLYRTETAVCVRFYLD